MQITKMNARGENHFKAKDLYQELHSYSEVGRLLGLSRQRVHQLVTNYVTITGFYHNSERKIQIFNKLRKKLCKCNNKSVVLHHLDGNSRNNNFSNLLPVCLSCHMRLHIERKRAHRQLVINLDYL